MEKKIVLLCDYGLDDAVATAFVLQKKKKDESIDIIPIGGNSAVEVSYRNAHTLLANYDGDKSGIRIVDSRAIPQPYVEHPTIHGKDGLGDLFAPQESDVEQITLEQFLSETGKFILVSLGPCTITNIILQRRKNDVSLLLVMGGNVNEKPNYNGYEFNHYLDISAFNSIVKQPHLIATLDSCRVPYFNFAGKRTEGRTLFEKLINRSISYAEARHRDNCYVYDFIAVYYLYYPNSFVIDTKKDNENNTLSVLRYID